MQYADDEGNGGIDLFLQFGQLSSLNLYRKGYPFFRLSFFFDTQHALTIVL